MDLSPSAIRRDLEASLKRLGVDHVDLLQLHDPDPRVPIEESWAQVQRLVSAQYQYNLIQRDVERESIPFCRARRIGVLSWGSLAEGLLTEQFDLQRLEPDDFRRSRPNFQEPGYSRIRMLVAELAGIASGNGHRATALDIAWLLAQDGLTSAIVGVRTEQEAVALAAAGRWRLTEEAKREVDAALSRFKGTAG